MGINSFVGNLNFAMNGNPLFCWELNFITSGNPLFCWELNFNNKRQSTLFGELTLKNILEEGDTSQFWNTQINNSHPTAFKTTKHAL
jgi:hypothetical protein